MKFKYRVFKALEPVAKTHPVFKWMSWLQAALTVAMPLVWPEVRTVYWLLSLALMSLWLSTYAILKLAFAHQPPQKGFRGWLSRVTEDVIFVVWLAVFATVFALFFKVVMQL